MNDKLNNILKDISSQKTFSIQNKVPLYEIKKESSNALLSTLNSIQNQNNNNIQIEKCKICNQINDLIKCQKCKNNYHLKCLHININGANFLCNNCNQKLFKVSENVKTNHQNIQNPKIEINGKKEIFKSTNNKIGNKRKREKKKEKDKDKEKEKMKDKEKEKMKDKEKEKMKEKEKGKMKEKDKEKEKEKMKDKEKEQSKGKNKKNLDQKITNKINPNNINNIQINNINIKEHKKRKGNKNPIDLLKKQRESYLILNYDHSNPQYKRRKIKIGINHQCDIYEFKNKYETQINFDEEEYERNQLKQVWSVSKNPFSKEEINKYLNTARLFWNYRNFNLENELCCDYFDECEKIMKKKEISEKLKRKIMKLMKELRELIRRGIDLNCHYDEMSLKMLHLCNYKMKVALFFLYKQLNPFIEEVEEGFKSDVLIFQNELFSMINDGDFYDPDE